MLPTCLTKAPSPVWLSRRLARWGLIGALLAFTACSSAPTRPGGLYSTKARSKLNRLYYETAMIQTPKASKKERALFIKHLPGLLKKRSARLKKGDSLEVIYDGKTNRLADQSHAVLRALWTTADSSYRGAELDLAVRLPEKQSAPVSVWVDLKGDYVLEEGRWVDHPTPKDPKALQERWKVGELRSRGAKWSDKALRSINLALGLLSDEERAVLRTIPFARRKKGKQKGQAALYIQQGDCDAFIQIYNRAIASERYTFAGDAQSPMPATVHPIIHEIGHAIHNRPSRVVQCELAKKLKAHNKMVGQANRSKGAKRKQLSKQLKQSEGEVKALKKRVKQLQGKGPILAGFQEALGGRKAPTRYGQTSLAEAFAESFALYRVDPEALKRALPKVHAWFARGGHLKGLP